MNGMRRCWILVSIFLLSSFVGFSSFNFNSELGTEIMEFGDSKDEPFTLYNEWNLQPGDYVEIDEPECSSLLDSEGFDRVTINICNIRIEVMNDQSCDFNGTTAICHVLVYTSNFDFIGYNDSDNYQFEVISEHTGTNWIDSDMNGGEKFEEVNYVEYIFREQSSSMILDDDWSWENISGTEYRTGIPESIQEGDLWIETTHGYEEYNLTTRDGEDDDEESGFDEYWHNQTIEAYDFVQIDLPPNQANPSAGNVTMDALMIRTTEDGEILDVDAVSNAGLPIQIHYYDDNNLTAIGNLSSWSFQNYVTTDTDNDGVSDSSDLCPDTVDGQSVNADGCAWYQLDDDGDGILNPLDQCEGFDDSIDVDNDGIIDGCDDIIDSDNDGVSDDEDQCDGQDDTIDVDNDLIIDCLDSLIDSDGDFVSDEDDLCNGFDDNIDSDNDGIPDDCDPLIDSDGDYISDENDLCEGFDDSIDQDSDGIPDGCDSIIDSDFDGVSDTDDTCDGHDDKIDVDSDGISDGCDPLIDSDGDYVPDEIDYCAATPLGEISNIEGCSTSQLDSDLDTIMDDADLCVDLFRGEYDTNPMDGCPDDSDGDGLFDENDLCPDSKPDVKIDEEGCEIIPESPDEGFLSGTAGIVTISIGTIAVIAIAVLMLFSMRGKSDSEFAAEPLTVSLEGPPSNHVGEMRNGYEVTMYPLGSNEWWWKDPSTGNWSRWN